MIIDFHTHCFHDKLADKALAVLERNCGCSAAIGPRVSDLEAAIDHSPVDLAVVMNIATNVAQTTHVNDFAISLLANPKLIPFGSVHPADEDFMKQLERLKNCGIKGIKFHPHYQGIYINDPRMIKQIRAALDMGFLITLHCGIDVGLCDPNYATPKDTADMLDAVGDVGDGAIILAHMGGYREFDDVEKYLVGRDVYFDTAYVYEEHPDCINDEQAVRIVRNHGVERILFATDSPWVDMTSYVNHIKNWDFSDTELQQILGINAQRLLKI